MGYSVAVNELSGSTGTRIQVVGPSGAGKSTLAQVLAERLGLPFVELDGLFWQPNWTETPDEEFAAALCTAGAEAGWVMVGNYFRHTSWQLWENLDTVIWLDFPLRTVLPRIVRRSWRRYRSNELLWRTNTQSFWPMFKLWSGDSLLGYCISRHGRYQEWLEGPSW